MEFSGKRYCGYEPKLSIMSSFPCVKMHWLLRWVFCARFTVTSRTVDRYFILLQLRAQIELITAATTGREIHRLYTCVCIYTYMTCWQWCVMVCNVVWWCVCGGVCVLCVVVCKNALQNAVVSGDEWLCVLWCGFVVVVNDALKNVVFVCVCSVLLCTMVWGLVCWYVVVYVVLWNVSCAWWCVVECELCVVACCGMW